MAGGGPDPVRAYLDHAATSPLRPEAAEAMLPVLTGPAGNPSGAHAGSRRARRLADDARDRLAELLGCLPGEVVVTSGGTEADNLAVEGTWRALAARPSPPTALVCAAFEHHAVLEACRGLAARSGAELRCVPAGKDGRVDLDALAEACTPGVGLVSVMTVNNETGVVQDLAAVAGVVRRGSPDALLHTDAVQAAPWLDLATVTAPCDLVSVSAHKFGGPMGVGALVVRGTTPLAPLQLGGGQERERRSGTTNVAGLVGMAAALDATVAHRPTEAPRVAGLRDRLARGLLAAVPGATWTGEEDAAPGFAHLRFDGVEHEALVVLLDQEGVAVSAGAACASGAVEASHVLLAMGYDEAAARSGIRCSLGWSTLPDEIDLALAAFPQAVARLRD
jgi:cysteine desulfurase